VSSADLVSSPNLLEDISIRLVSREDLPALEWEGAYLHFRRVYARAFHRQELGNALLWVVEREPGYLLAQLFILLRSEIEPDLADGRHRAFMHSFRVRPELRRRGLGSCLLQHTEIDLIERGFQWLFLHVANENAPAISFYEHHGYHRVSPVSGEWSYEDHRGIQRYVHEPGWRMSKELS
jgi:ribosomal protein S18 acetylase RimI-like enzyme